MNKRVQGLEEIESKIIEIEAAPKILQLNLDKIEKEVPELVKDRTGNLRTLLRRNVESAREALKGLLEGRVIYTPTEHQGKLTYGIKTTLKTGKVIDNIKYDQFGVPTGIEAKGREFIPSLIARLASGCGELPVEPGGFSSPLKNHKLKRPALKRAGLFLTLASPRGF